MTNHNSSKPPSIFRKSTWGIILIFVAIITLSGAVLFAPGCSPVSLAIKFAGLELQLQKGKCPFQGLQQ